MPQLMFGEICVWLALASSVSSLVLYALVWRGNESLRGWARLSYVLVAQGVIWAAAHLMFLVLNHRFEVNYVAEYSSRDLPTFYLVSSFWAGQQGTFFLWAIYGSVLGVIFMTRCRRSFEAPAMMVVAAVQLFLTLLLAAASPFVLAKPGEIPPDGQGLNVLLQNHWMVIHPPIMFLGFTSLAFPFAVGIAALLRREYDEWLEVAWPWVLFAWCALGTGLFMGGYWAYTVLGWGGFWGWDNVENASLIPWLATTALIHGMILQRERRSMRRANMLFALTPYLFVLYGSFLTRSGILADFSVHSFAAPAQIIYNILLVYVGVFVTVAAILFALRSREITSEEAYEQESSRGFYFIIGSWLLYASSFAVLAGTSWPLLSRIWGKPANAGQSFYNHWLFPAAILFCLMMGVSPFLKWRGKPPEAAPRVLGFCGGGAVLLGLLLTLANGAFFGESVSAPADAMVRTNPSAYSIPPSPQPSGVLLNGRTSAAGAVSSTKAVTLPGGEVFYVPKSPTSFGQAYLAALQMKNGLAYPLFAIAALFCILANSVVIYRIVGPRWRSWLPAGGPLTHVGVGLLFVGVITSMNYGGDAILNLDPGENKTDGASSVTYPDAVPLNAFGRKFSFQGYDISQDSQKANMRVAVQTGDETLVARPSLTMAKDGNMVHFPSIFKSWTEDLYLSPIKFPGMGRVRSFHASVEVTHDGETTILSPGMAVGDDGPSQTDTPAIPGTHFQLVLMNIRIPAKDSTDSSNFVELGLVHEGSFQKTGQAEATLKLNFGESGDLQGLRMHYIRSSVDQPDAEMLKQVNMAQVEVSTKPLINLVWLGTFFIIFGGALAFVRRRKDWN